MEAKRLRMVATNFAGDVIWQNRRPLSPQNDRDQVIDEILSFISEGMADIRAQFGKPLAFGIAACGVIDAKRHPSLRPAPAHGRRYPLRERIARQVQIPCVMDNNIRAMTLAEWVSGAAKGLNTFLCVAIRSGVGAGLVMNGRLRGGSHGFSGEMGYMLAPTATGSSWKTLQQLVSESAPGLDIEADGFSGLSERRSQAMRRNHRHQSGVDRGDARPRGLRSCGWNDEPAGPGLAARIQNVSPLCVDGVD